MSSTKCFRLNLAWGLDVSVVSTYTAVIRMWSQKPAQTFERLHFRRHQLQRAYDQQVI